MDFKEIFGEELGQKIEGVITEKNINLIVDDKEKPSYIPKTRFDEVINTKNQLKTQVGELAGELETLKKSAKGNDELTKAIEELQAKNKEMALQHEKEQIASEIKLKALNMKARDITDVLKFIDFESIEKTENGYKGIDEQLQSLKEKKSYFFETEDNQANRNNKPMNPSNGGASNFQSEKDKYTELYLQAVKNPNNKQLQHMLFLQKSKLKE